MSSKPEDRSTPVRWSMIALGVVSMTLGAVGVVVPGLPTTIFLILASYFFTRSCPPLDAWMRGSRLFKPYAGYLDRRQPMPLHAVAWTLFIIWLAIGISTLRLWSVLDPTLLIPGAVTLGSIASFSVVWWGRVSILREERVSGD